MNKHFVHKMKKCGERALAYVIALVKLILLTMMGLLCIELVMLIGNGIGMPEYHWLITIAYVAVNIFALLLLSKAVIEVISLLKPTVNRWTF